VEQRGEQRDEQRPGEQRPGEQRGERLHGADARPASPRTDRTRGAGAPRRLSPISLLGGYSQSVFPCAGYADHGSPCALFWRRREPAQHLNASVNEEEEEESVITNLKRQAPRCRAREKDVEWVITPVPKTWCNTKRQVTFRHSIFNSNKQYLKGKTQAAKLKEMNVHGPLTEQASNNNQDTKQSGAPYGSTRQRVGCAS